MGTFTGNIQYRTITDFITNAVSFTVSLSLKIQASYEATSPIQFTR